MEGENSNVTYGQDVPGSLIETGNVLLQGIVSVGLDVGQESRIAFRQGV